MTSIISETVAGKLSTASLVNLQVNMLPRTQLYPKGERVTNDSCSALALLCFAVLCCAVLCCAALRCAVLCCAVLCCAALPCAVLCCASPMREGRATASRGERQRAGASASELWKMLFRVVSGFPLLFLVFPCIPSLSFPFLLRFSACFSRFLLNASLGLPYSPCLSHVFLYLPSFYYFSCGESLKGERASRSLLRLECFFRVFFESFFNVVF